MKSLTITRGVGLAGVLTLLRAHDALAQSAAESTPLNLGHSGTAAHVSSGSTGGSLVRTVVGLFVVIAVIYGISWIMRQVKAGKSRVTGAGLVQVANLPLGTGRSVALVRVGRDLMLLGVAEQGVTTLRTYTEQEALAEGLVPSPEEPGGLSRGEPPVSRVVAAIRRRTVR
jgi:flagellar protein FliO/FliZ